MPVYAYRCDNCGEAFERRQSFTDKSLTRCPKCNKNTLKRVISPLRVVFKGSGFYSTDHRSPSGSGHSRKGDEEKGAGKDSGDKSDSKAESKAEAKSEAKAESKSEAKSEPKSEPKSESSK